MFAPRGSRTRRTKAQTLFLNVKLDFWTVFAAASQRILRCKHILGRALMPSSAIMELMRKSESPGSPRNVSRNSTVKWRPEQQLLKPLGTSIRFAMWIILLRFPRRRKRPWNDGRLSAPIMPRRQDICPLSRLRHRRMPLWARKMLPLARDGLSPKVIWMMATPTDRR